MDKPRTLLTNEESQLLRAAMEHLQHNQAEPAMIVRRVPYGFETNLDGYEAVLRDSYKKAVWEAALKRLIMDGLLKEVDAHSLSWSYEVTEKGFSALQ